MACWSGCTRGMQHMYLCGLICFGARFCACKSDSSTCLLGNEGRLRFLELGCRWRKPAPRGCFQETKVTFNLAVYVWQTLAHLDRAYLVQLHKQDILYQLRPANFSLVHPSELSRPHTRRKRALVAPVLALHTRPRRRKNFPAEIP